MSNISRKHFEALAAAFRRAHVDVANASGPAYGINVAAAYVAAELARFNPNFDSARFLEACEAPEAAKTPA